MRLISIKDRNERIIDNEKISRQINCNQFNKIESIQRKC